MLLLPFHVQGRRDTISYSQKAFEFLMPVEISCSGALKYLGKTPVPEGLIPHSLPTLQLHTATSRAMRCAGWMPWGREQLSGADLLCCGIPRHSSSFPESSHSRQGCPAEQNLHLKHRAPAHPEHGGCGKWFGAHLSPWHWSRRDPGD